MRSNRSSALILLGALALGGTLACGAIIGVKDIYLGEDAGSADGSIPDGTSSSDGAITPDGSPADGAITPDSAPPSDGGAIDAAVDATPCVADTGADPLNCGRCGHDCLGGTCDAGACQPVLFLNNGNARYMTVDGDTVYYTDDSVDALRSIGKASGSSPHTVCTVPSGAGPNSIQTDGTNAYFTISNGGPATSNTGGIAKCALATQGGSPSYIQPVDFPDSLVRSGANLFWVKNTDPPVVQGAAVTAASPTLIYTAPAGATLDLAVSGGSLFITDDDVPGTLLACPPNVAVCVPGAPLATDTEGIDGVTTTAARLIWANAVYPGTLYQAQLDGGAPEALVSGSPQIPHTLKTDDTYLYWLNAGAPDQATTEYLHGSVMRCPNANGVISCGAQGPDVLATEQVYVRSLTVDTDSIFWISDGQIWRLAK